MQANHLNKVSVAYANMLYKLRNHIDLVREGPRKHADKRLSDVRRYFVTIRGRVLGGGAAAAGEITSVSHVFQPSGRAWLANSR
jgi:hypothetical protein